MEWPVNGQILVDYSMDQSVYFPTLDQYRLSPAIAVQAVEGAPVMSAVDRNRLFDRKYCSDRYNGNNGVGKWISGNLRAAYRFGRGRG